jgi:serine/threonine protein kinase
MDCPSEEKLYEWVFDRTGEIPSDMADHIRTCPTCTKAVGTFALLATSLTHLKVTLDHLPAASPSPQPEPAVVPTSPASDMPKQISCYLILDKLGDGGMGVVYKAYDITSARMVAVKAIRPEYSRNSDYQKRFHAECRVAAQLDHPNVVRILGQGEDNGRLFYAMEYIRGTSLDRLLAKEGLMTAQTAASIIRQVAAGLGEAHRRQIVHRDVKPSNILLEDGLERVKLTDFGVVKDLSRQTAVTQAGELVGTLSFMAPEQIEGQPVTPATDIFAVGVVFYQLLTGKLPFNASTPTALMRQIAEEPHRSLGAFGPLVPPTLQHIIDRCLAKAPQERFRDGGELERALAESESTVIGSVPARPFTRRPRQARAWMRLAVVACCLAAIRLVGHWQLFCSPAPTATNPPNVRPAGTAYGQPGATAAEPFTPDKTTSSTPLLSEGAVDLLEGVGNGLWKNVVANGGSWMKVPQGYRLFPSPGSGPDFGWAYPLPPGTTRVELTIVFKMSAAGAFQVVFRDKPAIFDDIGVAVSYKWFKGLSAGDLPSRSSPYVRTIPLEPQDLLSDWHTLRIVADAKHVSGRIDDGERCLKVIFQDDFKLQQILLSGDEFIDLYIREFRARFIK